MNNIDNIKTVIFQTPYELAMWIKDNVANELRQEQLMYVGVQYKHFHKTHYQIEVELSHRDRILPRKVTEFDLSLRAINALKYNNIETIAQLVNLTKRQFRMLHHVGTKTRYEIQDMLWENDLDFNYKIVCICQQTQKQ